ncbi:MAG: dimethylarginine dimethylaminohydrolase [Proteobacteria bacterium]|nr:dimethylarginine dimethylaminohydrolase [Pseudomonadota bacterium]
MTFSSYQFSHALTRKPGRSVAKGLRDGGTADPDPNIFEIEHAAYVAALKEAGVAVAELPPDEGFPDSVFIEDPALCLRRAAILLRPGAPTRLGERETLRDSLRRFYPKVLDLPEGGFVDGGDILTTEREVLIGLSARTNEAGAEALRPLVEADGRPLRLVNTPPEILHFKTECGLLDEKTIFATEAILASGCFGDYETIACPEGEEAAANLIRVNDQVFLSKGHPKTAELLQDRGYQITELATSQAARVDGGLSCMSLRFTPPKP